MNEKGQSWPEAMLSLVIILVIFGSLLPLATTLMLSVAEKKQVMIAAETSYQAAIHFNSSGKTAGRRTHESIHYDWTIATGQVCVAYTVQQIEHTKCVNL